MDEKNKVVKISEPHKFAIGGGSWGTTTNFIKIQFMDNISKERAEEIAHQLMEVIDKN